MKIAISGKGGVGKTTFAALLARAFSSMEKHVLAIDADPDANFASALGIPDSESITPISHMKELIHERTEVKSGTIGGFFKMNPTVDDLPDSLSVTFENIKFMRLGGIQKGGGGCICPESTLLKALITHVVIGRDEIVIMDMEAGIEHLGRATASSVDKLIVVVEPGKRSIETLHNIHQLANDIGLKEIAVMANKVRNAREEAYILEQITTIPFLGCLPYETIFIESDLAGESPYENDTQAKKIVFNIAKKLLLSQ
jgi:CO dehydrogenase maturation factor